MVFFRHGVWQDIPPLIPKILKRTVSDELIKCQPTAVTMELLHPYQARIHPDDDVRKRVGFVEILYVFGHFVL